MLPDGGGPSFATCWHIFFLVGQYKVRPGQINVYDLASSQLKRKYTFADPIAVETFSPDGTRLFVVTASQTAYILDVTARD